MAATRPVVLVFQEFATLSSSPATPELNCLIAGPAYWIQDFPEDRNAIKLTSTYGTVTPAATGSSAAPLDGSEVIVLTDAPNNKVGAVLDALSVRVFFGKPSVEISNAGDMTSTASSANVASAATNFATAGVKPNDTAVLTNPSSSTTLVKKVRSVSGQTITLTDEMPGTGFTKIRIERELAEQEIDADHISVVAGTNTIKVLGGVTLLVSGVAKKVVSADVYVAYRSLRQDLATVNNIGSVTELTGMFGRVSSAGAKLTGIDARNPLAVGAFVALQNTNTSIQLFGVQSDDLAGFNAMKSALAPRKDIYAVVPLSKDINVVAALKSEFESLADPDYALTNGVPQKFRVVIGGGMTLPTSKIMVDKNTDGQVSNTNSPAPGSGDFHTLAFSNTTLDLVALGVLPGFKVEVDWDGAGAGAATVYTVTHVNSAAECEVAEDLVSAATVTGTTVTVKNLAGVAVATSVTADTDKKQDDKLYLELLDANGAFIDAFVIPGDIIEMPLNTNSAVLTDETPVGRYVIETVASNQRVKIVNNGRNTATGNVELPHGVTRSAPVAVVASTATLPYRIVRTLNKNGQVEALVATSQSVKSRRAILTWPDLVDVAGLVDGSLPRDPADPVTAQPAGSQPGYYLSCAVGGMTAGLPSHQGFTNLAIAGIKKLYNSNTYFDDKQITDISNGGWFLFQQDVPSALPYVVHQLTTDPSTLQFGEFSLVKNFDFVSLFFADILDDFIGIWNINPETIGFITAAVNAGIENLKLRRRIRIGAPINDATLTSIGESAVAEDRLELFVEVDFPKPLNVVGLHLVSV